MGRTLVTGATGFLGQAVVAYLRAAGMDVVATGRNPTRCAAINCVPIDLASPVVAWPNIGHIEWIVHCAALPAPFGRKADFVRANVTATYNLLTFAKAQSVSKFVQVSTSSVSFSFCDQLGVKEHAQLPTPVNSYAETKRQAEQIVLAATRINPIVLRPRGIYGVGDTTLLPRLLRTAAQRPLPIFREGIAKIDLTHVDDVVSAVMAALGSDVSDEIFNISGGEVLPIRHLVDQASAKAGVSVQWQKRSFWPAMALLQGC